MYSKEIRTLHGTRILKLDLQDFSDLETFYPGYELGVVYIKEIPFVQIQFSDEPERRMLHYLIGRRNYTPTLHPIDYPKRVFYHKNEDTFDNRSENIGTAILDKPPYKGMTWDKRANKWRSQIWVDGSVKHLGNFHTPEEAHIAYVIAREKFADQRVYNTGM